MMYKNCCILKNNEKRITDELDKLGYFCENANVKQYTVITHGVYGYADEEDLDRFQKYCKKNHIENFYIDCECDEDKFLKLASEEM